MSLGKTLIVGFVGNDAQLQFTKKGTPYSFFSVAYTEKFKAAGGEQKEETTWYECKVWGKRGEAVNEYIHKGTHLYLEGVVMCGSYINNENKLVRKLNLNVRYLKFLDRSHDNRIEEVVNEEADSIDLEAEELLTQSFAVPII